MIYLALGSVTVVNRLHFVKPDYTTSDMIDLAQACVDGWLDHLSQFSNQISLTQVRVTDMRTEDGPVVPYTIGLPLPGGKIEQPLPLSDCVVVTLRTVRRGRSGRGRVYVTGFCEDQWDGQNFSSGATGAAQGLISDIRDYAIEKGWGLVVASFYSNGQPRQQAQVTSVSVIQVRNTKVGSQRRRDARP
jgi:hypothetical protein